MTIYEEQSQPAARPRDQRIRMQTVYVPEDIKPVLTIEYSLPACGHTAQRIFSARKR